MELAAPELLPALRGHPHVGWLLVRSEQHGAVVLGRRRQRVTSRRTEWRARIRSSISRPTASRATCCGPTDSRTLPDLLVGSFYDSALDEGCAFEELISFHGGLGGPQTRPFLLHPADLPLPAEPIVGAEQLCTRVLVGWRAQL